MRQCIYCKIKDTNADVLFFELPKDKNLLELWYENMGFNLNLLPSSTKYLCSQHFTPDCVDVDNKVLRHGSVPTIFQKHMSSLVLINKHNQIIDKVMDGTNAAGPSSVKRSPRTCNSIYRNKTSCNKIQRSIPRAKPRKIHIPPDFNSPASSRVCRICLEVDVKMYHMTDHDLKSIYEQVTGVTINPVDKLPQMLCWECVARLLSANKLIKKAMNSQLMMAEIDGMITIGDIKAINRSKAELKSTLGIFKINDTDNIYVEDIKQEIDDINNDDHMVEIHDMNIIDEDINIKDDMSDSNKVLNIEIDICNDENSESNKPAIVNMSRKRKNYFKRKKKLKSVKIENVDEAMENISNNDELDDKDYPEVNIINKEVSVASTESKCNESKMIKDKEIKTEDTQVNDNEVEIFYTDHPEIIIINIDRDVSENNGTEGKINDELENDNEVHFESIVVSNEEIVGEDGEEIVSYENITDNEESFNKDEEVEVFYSENKEINVGDKENVKVVMIGDDSADSDDLESSVFDITNYEEVKDQENDKKMKSKINDRKRKSNNKEVVKEKTVIEDKDKSESDAKAPPALPEFNETRPTYVEQIQEIKNRKETEAFKNSKFKCDYCYKGFGQEDVYQMHMHKHSKSIGKMECFICKMKFKSSSGLKKHLLTLHVVKYSCKFCSFDTYQRSVAQKHAEQHREKIYKCQHCSRTFHKLTTYQGHLRVKHVSDYVCELCGFTFVTPRGIRAHKYTTHKYHDENTPLEGPYCDACDIKFLSQEAYTVHLKKSSKHTNNSELAKAQNQRVHKPRFSCELCDTILNRDNYVQHYRENHPDTSTLMCDQCGKMFNTLLLFKNHKCLYVDDVKQVVCDKCGLIFEKKIHLHVHRNRVHNHKGYKCKVCDKHFLTDDHRSRHTRYMHANHRSHKCDICLKFYKSQSNLKAHIAHTHMKVPWPRRTKSKEQK